MTLRFIQIHVTCDACDDDYVVLIQPGDDWNEEKAIATLTAEARLTSHLCDDCAAMPAVEPPAIPPTIDVTIAPKIGYRVVMSAVRDLPEEKGEYLGTNGDGVGTVRVDEVYREETDDDGLREVLIAELVVDLPELSANQLLEIYNEKAAMLGVPQPKKFKNKITAMTRLAALIAHLETPQPAETP